jgi:hypothetical protein
MMFLPGWHSMPASLVQSPSVKKQIHRKDAKNAKQGIVKMIKISEQVIPTEAEIQQTTDSG